MPKQNPLIVELLALTEKPYEEYNAVLETIMTRLPLDVQVQTFQRVLGEELPLTTVRRAYRTAIRVAMGDENVPREYSPKPARGKRQPGRPSVPKNNSEK